MSQGDMIRMMTATAAPQQPPTANRQPPGSRPSQGPPPPPEPYPAVVDAKPTFRHTVGWCGVVWCGALCRIHYTTAGLRLTAQPRPHLASITAAFGCGV